MELLLLFGLALTAVLAWSVLCRFDQTGGRFAHWGDHPRVRQARSWFCKRFRRDERFGLSLTVGLLVSLLAGWLFGELADEIFEAELLTQLDLAFGEGLLGLVSETTSQFFSGSPSSPTRWRLLPVWFWQVSGWQTANVSPTSACC